MGVDVFTVEVRVMVDRDTDKEAVANAVQERLDSGFETSNAIIIGVGVESVRLMTMY